MTEKREKKLLFSFTYIFLSLSGNCCIPFEREFIQEENATKFTYPLVPYPHTYIALYFLYARVTCNTHKNKKLLSILLKLVPSLAKLPLPYFLPSTGRSASSHPNSSFQFLAPCCAFALYGAFLTFVRSRIVCGVKVTGVYFMTLFP